MEEAPPLRPTEDGRDGLERLRHTAFTKHLREVKYQGDRSFVHFSTWKLYFSISFHLCTTGAQPLTPTNQGGQ